MQLQLALLPRLPPVLGCHEAKRHRHQVAKEQAQQLFLLRNRPLSLTEVMQALPIAATSTRQLRELFQTSEAKVMVPTTLLPLLPQRLLDRLSLGHRFDTHHQA